MNRSKYVVSLRITHPTCDPIEITRALGRTPRSSWRAGDILRNGTIREYTFWTSRILPKTGKPDIYLAEDLDCILDQLAIHVEFFGKMRLEGGSAELFVGWFFEGDTHDQFELRVLTKLVNLNLDLGLDIYVPDSDCPNGDTEQ